MISPSLEVVPAPATHQVPRIPAAAASYFFDDYYLRERPVIISGLVREWPCHERWTIPQLKRMFGGHDHTFQYEDGKTLEMSVAAYLEILEASASDAYDERVLPAVPSPTERLPYIRHLGPLGGTFYDAYPIRSLFPDASRYSLSSFLFCGVPGTKTNCHYDWTHNFVGMLHGVKHVTLLPPRAEQHMRVPEELRARMAVGNCDYFDDPGDLDLGRGRDDQRRPMHEHPVFVDCPEVYHATITDGDVVFFPAYWYHYFHNVTGSISVTTQSCLL